MGCSERWSTSNTGGSSEEDIGSDEEEQDPVGESFVAATAMRRGGGGAEGQQREALIQAQFEFGPFYFFIFIKRGGQLIRLSKSVIYHDLTLPASQKVLCSSVSE